VGKPSTFDPIAEASRQWDRHWGTAATPSMSAVTSVMRVHQILMARLNGLLRPYGLTFPRYEALMLLYYSRRGSLPLGKMGQRLQVHRTSVTNTIDGLERQGYVERQSHDSDRRTTLAAITKRGRQAAEEATAALNEDRFGTAPLRQGELEGLTETLRRVRIDAGDFENAVSS
jgi:DNA-binding MarR family transcriptional regulator